MNLKDRRSIGLTASGLLLIGLTGCSSNMGVAAEVGDRKLLVSTVQESVNKIVVERKAVRSTADQKASDLNRSQLRFLMLSELVDRVATKLNINVTPADIDARRKAISDQIGGSNKLRKAIADAGIAEDDFARYLTDVIVEDRLGVILVPGAPVGAAGDAQRGQAVQDAIRNEALSTKINVNPRYGTWDPTRVDVVLLDTTGGSVFPLK